MMIAGKGKVTLKIILVVTVALLFAAVLFDLDVARYLQPDAITIRLDSLGTWAPVVYTAVMALVVITPLPSLPLNIAAGAYFGPFWGTLLSVSGATLGALISFLLARFLGRELIERFLKGHVSFCTSCADRLLTKLVLLGRLVPVLPFDIISYGAGLTKMSARNFVAANVLGMLPLTFAYNYVGSAITVGRGVSIVLGLLFVSLFFLLPYWIERYDLFSLRAYLERHERGERAPDASKKE